MKLFGKRPALAHTRIGHVLAVHPRKAVNSATFFDDVTPLADEPGHTIVAVDLEPGADPGEFEEVVDVLADCPGTLRLVPAWPGCASSLKTAEWLAGRLGRTVIGHEGRPHQTPGGGLFIPPHEGPGWMSFETDGARSAHSRRFPTPGWECEVLCRAGAVGSYTVEPIAAGAWIHPAGGASAAQMYRRRLQENLTVEPRFPRIVVGFPGTQTCPPTAVAEFWRTLPEAGRHRVRFSRFGVRRPGPDFGQSLADTIGAPVVVGTGVLLAASSPDVSESHTLLPEGAVLWTPYVADLRYAPLSATRGRIVGPVPVDARPPIADLVQTRPGVFEYAQDTVLEVTQSGMYLRPAAEPARATAVRLLPPQPGSAHLVVDDADPQHRQRLTDQAAELLERLEPRQRKATRVVSARAALAALPPPGPGKAPGKPPTGEPRPRPRPTAAEPKTNGAPPRTTPPGRPSTAATASAGARDVGSERAWLRRQLESRYAVVATQLSTLLHGDLLPDPGDGAHSDVLTDLVAARLYLTGSVQRPGGGVRNGEDGGFSRLLAAYAAKGLSRLPAYHGPVFADSHLGDEVWEIHDDAGTFAVPSLRRAVTQGSVAAGGPRIAVWSVSARQAAQLLPERPHVVVFLPGTRFEVLTVDRGRHRALLREHAGAGLPTWPWAQEKAMTELLETAERQRAAMG